MSKDKLSIEKSEARGKRKRFGFLSIFSNSKQPRNKDKLQVESPVRRNDLESTTCFCFDCPTCGKYLESRELGDDKSYVSANNCELHLETYSF